MPAHYVEIPTTTMEAFMQKRGFSRVIVPMGHEVVYQRERTEEGFFVVRIWSSLPKGGAAARDVGEDAIRVQLVYVGNTGYVRDGAERTPRVALGAVLYQTTRVHRTQNWETTLDGRMREAWLAMRLVKKCPKCKTLPMRERNSANGKFLGCVGWKKGGAGCSGTMNIETRRTA